ncbi:MAG: hypothetical protein JWO22_3788 [Frankiales bacterium]|nr:hypothetical protein [Frankiales bacterium]
MTQRRPRVFGLFQTVFGFLAFGIAVFAIPISAIDSRDHAAAVSARDHGRTYDASQIREHVRRHTSRGSVSYSTDKIEATYGGGRTVLLRGFSTGGPVEDREGWYVVYTAKPDLVPERIRVGPQGAFLESDYDELLAGEFDDVHLGFAVWIALWTVVWVLTTVERRRRQLARGLSLAPARSLAVRLTATAAGAYLALYLASFPLEHYVR